MVALVVLGPEQMPVVARGLIKIIRELRAAANDTISEIRQSLEEPPPAEREQWTPPGHQGAGGESRTVADDASHSAERDTPAQDEPSPGDHPSANLETSVGDQTFEAHQDRGHREPPPADDAPEPEQVWETAKAAEHRGTAQPGDASQALAPGEAHAPCEPAQASECHQASENRPIAEAESTFTAGAPLGDNPTGPPEAAPMGREAAREDGLSADGESVKRLSGKPQSPHTPS